MGVAALKYTRGIGLVICLLKILFIKLGGVHKKRKFLCGVLYAKANI
jgi:hypothetical protein